MCQATNTNYGKQQAVNIATVGNCDYSHARNVGTLQDIAAESLLPIIFEFLGESRDVLSIQCTCKDFYENLNCPYLLYDFQILGEPGNDKVKNVIAHVEYPPAAIACLEMYASCGNLKAINL